MKTSKNGIEMIKEFEGFREEAYKCVDSEKYYTIGYGHYGADVNEGDVITEEKAEEFLKNDLKNAEAAVENYYAIYKWNQNQFDAMVSFAFNIGNIHQLTNYGKRTIAEISDAMLLYVKAGGQVLEGLRKRRQKERELFLTPTTDAAQGTKKITTQLLKEVLDGKWENGDVRIQSLNAAGYDAAKVQFEINKYYTAADNVIKGKYGNYPERKTFLEREGFDYELVQRIVNEKVK